MFITDLRSDIVRQTKAIRVVRCSAIPQPKVRVKIAAINVGRVQARLDLHRLREVLMRRGPVLTVVVVDAVIGDLRRLIEAL